MSDISDTEKLDASERIRIGLDFLEMFVDKKGKLNVTAMREKFEQYEARIAELEAGVMKQHEEIQRLREAAEQVVFECEADDDAMMPSVQSVRKLRALLGGGE